MTVQERIHQLVDRLGQEEAGDLLEYAEWLAAESDSLTPEELEAMAEGEREVEGGQSVSLEDLERIYRAMTSPASD